MSLLVLLVDCISNVPVSTAITSRLERLQLWRQYSSLSSLIKVLLLPRSTAQAIDGITSDNSILSNGNEAGEGLLRL